MRHLTALPDLSELSDVTVTLAPESQTADGSVPLVGYLVLAPAGTQPAQLSELFAAQVSSAAAANRPAAVTTEEPAAPRGIVVDTEERTASVDGAPLELTYLEFELLAHLVRHPHRVYTRESLVATIWGYGPVGDQRTVDVHVARLRRKLGPAYRERIVTVRRVGYKYVPPAG
ncbi:Transcriptional regulatory protein, C terminal [Streptomyces zhaozhouensis]|uniref:Transcriptional regulatory protein, C terminal n=1 Tax=Streptomyces zhaozhouensis TaxID=1300267 RepID=A0A286DZ92_9ACTN|nr:winged helix-turn-helix domain-containing protein [Streptomyces zhaozhouensis]SOD63894.1 Transcriptional regulatory protein, C terminal [Streptomyces zhaozhouensis]